jgi:hypothetical protein
MAVSPRADAVWPGYAEGRMRWTERTGAVKVGDTVMYSRAWLRSTGQFTGDICFARGTVNELQPLGEVTLAVIDWGGADLPEKVNVKNLSRVTERGVMDRD